MSELSGISGPKHIQSKPRASMESIKEKAKTEASSEMKALEKFEGDLQQINRAFALVSEIRESLESRLQALE